LGSRAATSVQTRWLSHGKGDLVGGVTSAILTIPVSMGYGILEDLVCYVLTDEAFERLARERQPITIKLLKNPGRELSRGLRRANQTIYELEA
jgi:hypothetical protein